eukprot:1874021-Alexandrium_andersonii.AAC.1
MFATKCSAWTCQETALSGVMVSVNPTIGPSRLTPDCVLQLEALTDRGARFRQPRVKHHARPPFQTPFGGFPRWGQFQEGVSGGWAGGRQWEWGRR